MCNSAMIFIVESSFIPCCLIYLIVETLTPVDLFTWGLPDVVFSSGHCELGLITDMVIWFYMLT